MIFFDVVLQPWHMRSHSCWVYIVSKSDNSFAEKRTKQHDQNTGIDGDH